MSLMPKKRDPDIKRKMRRIFHFERESLRAKNVRFDRVNARVCPPFDEFYPTFIVLYC